MNISTTNIPKVRFPEFQGVWDNVKISDLGQFHYGKGAPKFSLVEEGGTPCVRYGELYRFYPTQITEVVSRSSVEAAQLRFSNGDEILVPRVGEDPLGFATHTCHLTVPNIAIGEMISVFKTSEDSLFYTYYFRTKKKQFARVVEGGAVSNLYYSYLEDVEIGKPSLLEQHKVASFLSAIDKKISQLRQKIAALEQYKQGCLQQLFSQKIRFTREDDSPFPDWEWIPLSKIGARNTDKNTDFEHKRILTNSATKGVVYQSVYFENDIAKADKIDEYYIVKKGDFVYNPRISNSAPVGPIKRNNLTTGVMSPLYVIFSLPDETAPFYEQYFNSSDWFRYMKRVANFGARHDRMAISRKDFEALPLPCPDADERQRITEFLSAIDSKIELTAHRIEKTQGFKTGLLQQMFV